MEGFAFSFERFTIALQLLCTRGDEGDCLGIELFPDIDTLHQCPARSTLFNLLNTDRFLDGNTRLMGVSNMLGKQLLIGGRVRLGYIRTVGTPDLHQGNIFADWKSL